MNEKEVSELRRRFRQDRTGITHVRGCYVNEVGEIVSQFQQSLGVMSQEENEKILALLKRTLSGTLGKNLLDLTFATQQVVDSPEHKQLMALRQSRLRDEEAVDTFFHQVIDSVELDGNYLILLIHDSYDVPYHSKDGEELEDGAQEVYSYILCSICPVKQTKPALSYYVQENQFRSLSPDWIVSPPELGFLFPAFDDRAANLYGALYYTKNTKVMQEDLIEKLFHVTPPMPAAEQKEQFDIALSEALGEACSFEVIQGVQDQLCGMIAEHKESKIKEPLLVDRGTMRQVLATCGVGEQELQEFDEQYTQSFGADTQLSPTNLVNTKQMELQSDYIQIKVDAERTDLIQTRVINGVKYVMIQVEDGVLVNGVNIQI